MIHVQRDSSNQQDRHRHYSVTGVQEGHTVSVCVRREHVGRAGGESSDRHPVAEPRDWMPEEEVPTDPPYPHKAVDPAWWHLWLVGRDRDPDVDTSSAQAAIDAVRGVLE